jgi:hypothetical protein
LIVTGLTAGTTYSFKVASINIIGTSLLSSVLTTTTLNYTLTIGLGEIADQIYILGTPLILALPQIVTNPAGVSVSIKWSLTSNFASISKDNKITINLPVSTQIGSATTITITALDSISGLSVTNTF